MIWLSLILFLVVVVYFVVDFRRIDAFSSYNHKCIEAYYNSKPGLTKMYGIDEAWDNFGKTWAWNWDFAAMQPRDEHDIPRNAI